jgi:DnaJ-class molecular chaperone
MSAHPESPAPWGIGNGAKRRPCPYCNGRGIRRSGGVPGQSCLDCKGTGFVVPGFTVIPYRGGS